MSKNTSVCTHKTFKIRHSTNNNLHPVWMSWRAGEIGAERVTSLLAVNFIRSVARKEEPFLAETCIKTSGLDELAPHRGVVGFLSWYFVVNLLTKNQYHEYRECKKNSTSKENLIVNLNLTSVKSERRSSLCAFCANTDTMARMNQEPDSIFRQDL